MAEKLTELLGDLQLVLVKDLLDRIRGGEATASDLNVARALLRDNSITATIEANRDLGDMAALLPFKARLEDDVAQGT